MTGHGDVVDEGVAIALSAARLVVKNRILMATLGEDEPFDRERAMAVAASALSGLARESRRASRRIDRERSGAHGQPKPHAGMHDYSGQDVPNLMRRARISLRVAEELERLAADHEALGALADRSREAAWDEVAANIERGLRMQAAAPADEGEAVGADPEDHRKRLEALREALDALRADADRLAATEDQRRKRRRWLPCRPRRRA